MDDLLTSENTHRAGADLFAVDVDSEIDKLTQSRFKLSGEHAVELVRFAGSLEPSRIDVEVNRHQMAVHCDGARPISDMVKKLVTVFHPAKSSDERHKAMVDLEAQWGLSILAAFARQPSRVEISFWAKERSVRAVFPNKRAPKSLPAATSDNISIAVTGGRRNPTDEKRLLVEKCRFSQIPISLNGTRISRGMKTEGCILQIDIANNRLEGTVGLPLKDDMCRVTRLSCGVVEGEVVRPARSGLLFHAVVAERDRNFIPTWETLKRAAKRLYEQLGSHLDKLSDKARARAVELLFERYAATRTEQLLSGVKVFKRAFGQPLELADISAAARKRPIYAVDLEDPLDRYELADRLVLRLDACQRRFLHQRLKIELRAPPLRADRVEISVASRLKELAWQLGNAFHKRPGRPIPDRLLDPDELAFLEGVRAEIRSGAFALPAEPRPFDLKIDLAVGQKTLWSRQGRSGKAARYTISLEHPRTAEMVQAFAADPSYIYPAVVALTGGHDGYAQSRDAAQKVILDRLRKQ